MGLKLKVNIGLVQLEIRDGDIETNINKGINYITKLAEIGSDLIIAPELWPTGYDRESILKFSSNIRKYEELIDTLKTISNKFKSVIVAPMPVKEYNGIYNAAVVIYKDDIIAIYKKMHLFRLFHEDEIFIKGDDIALVHVKGFNLGLAICYDLRFPELFRILSAKEAHIIAIPASWGAPRVKQWRTLLRARAMENQVYVVGVNRVGYSEVVREDFSGNSCVIDPLGDEVVCLGRHEEAVNITIDLDYIKKARSYIPLWSDRRVDLYSLRSKWGHY